jgi:hypothetical protein
VYLFHVFPVEIELDCSSRTLPHTISHVICADVHLSHGGTPPLHSSPTYCRGFLREMKKQRLAFLHFTRKSEQTPGSRKFSLHRQSRFTLNSCPGHRNHTQITRRWSVQEYHTIRRQTRRRHTAPPQSLPRRYSTSTAKACTGKAESQN